MKTSSSCAFMVGLAFLLVASISLAASQTYPDGHGGKITLPLGDASFADAVVDYDTGSEKPIEWARDAEKALGTPDYSKRRNRGYASLGCGGELVLKFTDNALIDVAGPDLYVFEVGPAVEPTALAISKDGENWVRVGRIEGGKAEIDIAPYVGSKDEFRYVRLVDLKDNCGGRTPGADIDAVAAIGSAQRIALNGEVLFDSGEYTLKPVASGAIDAAITGIDTRALESVVVAGYTDSVGNAEANQVLSQNRARSVADYLTENAGLAESRVETHGYGASQPVADNGTAKGRAKNRRVEITVHSARNESGEHVAKVDILGLWMSGSKRVIELRKKDGAILGHYTSNGGLIRGKFTSDTVFEGYWIKDKSSHTCDTEKQGSKYWGYLRFEFDSPARDQFDVKWGYCDDENGSGKWPHAKRLL